MADPRDQGSGGQAGARGRDRARPVADLIGNTIAPAARKRGFATVDLFSYWGEIVGPAYADHTQPERLTWPKRLEDGGEHGFVPATLIIRCEGARALMLSHEAPQILERINAVFGYAAVGRIRIVQKPIVRQPRPPAIGPASLPPAAEAKLQASLGEIEDDGLRQALARLGRAVLSARAKS